MSIEHDGIGPTISQVRLDREETDNCELMPSRCTEGQTGGHKKQNEKM
jgi:hypothetical protein